MLEYLLLLLIQWKEIEHLKFLKEVADELTISFFVHTMSKGIYDISSGKVLSEDKSIYSAIDYMSDQMKRRQNLTLVLTGIPDISSEIQMQNNYLTWLLMPMKQVEV